MPTKELISHIKTLFHRERISHCLKAVALTAYQAGLGYRLVSRILAAYGSTVSHIAVRDWVLRCQDLPLAVRKGRRKRIACDEKILPINGQQFYVWIVVDIATEEVLAFHVSRGASIFDAVYVIKSALHFCRGKMPRLFTDRGVMYRAAASMCHLNHTIICFGPRSSVERSIRHVAQTLERLGASYRNTQSVLQKLTRWVTAVMPLRILVRQCLT